MVAFPLVGAVVGLAWALTSRVLIVLPRTSAVAAAAILMVDAGLTRAMHLRAFADVMDQRTGGSSPADAGAVGEHQQAGEVAPDGLRPAAGAGVAALVLLILLRFAVLFFAAEFDYRLLTVPLSGRAAMIWLLWRAAAEEPHRTPLTAALGRPAARALWLAAVLSVLGALAGGTRGIAALGLALAVGVGWGLWWRRDGSLLSGPALAAGGLVAETVALVTLGAV